MMGRGLQQGAGRDRPRNRPTVSGDAILVGYDCSATFPDGTVDTVEIREPLAGTDGARAIAQYLEWREPYAVAGVPVSFRCVWLCRADAITRGFITGSDDR
ncbi:MAG TPA: hypothetical protein VIV60_18860 [Polyangiaceae bacterium]